MAKRKEEQIDDSEVLDINSKEFFNELISDTNFVMADTGSLMNSRMKVTTPLYVINCIYGGGVPLGIISEISGPPASGKSTFCYQCMGNYQREFKDGVAVIYDMESSMDNYRLKVLGVDTERVLRLPATTLEEAFSNMFTMFGKLEKMIQKYPNLSSFQIYDTISAGGTNKQHQATEGGNSAFNAGSMMEAPRIIKQNLMNVFPYLEKFPVFIGLINQVFMQGIGGYAPKAASGGGYGLKHACHSHIQFGSNSDVYENGFLIGTESLVKLEKSKLSPKLVDIPCYMDVTNGGKIDEVTSFVKYLINKGIVVTGSWYNIKDTVRIMTERYPILETKAELQEFRDKNIRKDDFYKLCHENKDLLNFLQIRLIDYIDDIYKMQRDVNGEYQKKLISECKYFREDIDENNTEEVLNAIEESLNS